MIKTSRPLKAIRQGEGYGLYHAEGTYPNGDTFVLCENMGPHFTEQQFPGTWEECVNTMPAKAVCPDCVILAESVKQS